MATITGKRFQMTDGAASPINLFPYTVSEAVYGLNNSISNAISSALSTISLSTYAGTSAIGSSTQPVYYNGSALVATDLSTTYAPYNAAGYLPLTGGTLTGSGGNDVLIQLSTESATSWMGFRPSDGTFRYIGINNSNELLFQYASLSYTVWHSGNSNKIDVPWTCSSLQLNAFATNETGIYFRSGFDTPSTKYNCSILSYDHSSGGTDPDGISINSYDGISFCTGSNTRNEVARFSQSGNLGIGTTSPTQKLHVEGGVYASYGYRTTNDFGLYKGSNISHGFTDNDGALYYSGYTLGVWANVLKVFATIDSTGDQVISSDETLKTNLQDVTYSVSDIAKCRAVTFDWKDGHGHSAGSIAQDWKPLIPELVHGEEGGMTLAYGQIALVNSILEAREIERLKERVAELENQLRLN